MNLKLYNELCFERDRWNGYADYTGVYLIHSSDIGAAVNFIEAYTEVQKVTVSGRCWEVKLSLGGRIHLVSTYTFGSQRIELNLRGFEITTLLIGSEGGYNWEDLSYLRSKVRGRSEEFYARTVIL